MLAYERLSLLAVLWYYFSYGVRSGAMPSAVDVSDECGRRRVGAVEAMTS